MVDDLRYAALFADNNGWNRPGSQWAVVCMAFSALGSKMTGLPVDPQPNTGLEDANLKIIAQANGFDLKVIDYLTSARTPTVRRQLDEALREGYALRADLVRT
jgi:hypothetical protein